MLKNYSKAYQASKQYLFKLFSILEMSNVFYFNFNCMQQEYYQRFKCLQHVSYYNVYNIFKQIKTSLNLSRDSIFKLIKTLLNSNRDIQN